MGSLFLCPADLCGDLPVVLEKVSYNEIMYVTLCTVKVSNKNQEKLMSSALHTHQSIRLMSVTSYSNQSKDKYCRTKVMDNFCK